MPDRFKHIRLYGTTKKVPYIYAGPTPNSKFNTPPRPAPNQHGPKILQELASAMEKANKEISETPAGSGLSFIPMELIESSDFSLMIEQFERDKLGVKIINAREVDGKNCFTVALPNEKVPEFELRIRRYISELDRYGNPKYEKLLSGVDQLNPFDWSQYWTDNGPIPSESEVFWWEIWLSYEGQSSEFVVNWFRDNAARQNIKIGDRHSEFPERVVFLGFASFAQWKQFPSIINYLAELRRAMLIAGEFLSLDSDFQGELIRGLKNRLIAADLNAPAVCILDTGVNRGHPLLESSLSESNLLAWRLDWESADHDGHGTEMAGLALFGDTLASLLLSSDTLSLSHRLESVKILPPSGENEAPQYGPITIGAMLLIEDSSARQRVFSMAVTARGDNVGGPSLWSASIDQITSGALDDIRRLCVVSAGNIEEAFIANYPNDNYTESVEDPSQAWNALTVGAFTDLVIDTESSLKGYRTVAPRGALAPASRTSLTWTQSHWPYKPDVVFEGGNRLISENGFVTNSDDLSLLTVSLDSKSTSLLASSRDTSAATAQAARMAAILQAEYPDYWPETIRGLIVHSASWNSQMLKEFPRSKRAERIRVYGMGVPDIKKARDTIESLATMVIEEFIQPFRSDGSTSKFKDMHIHKLPIPVDVLQDLGSTPIKMKVTLSYFIEPNPPRRGDIAQFRYASHGLRFSMIRPGENLTMFQNRLTQEDWQLNDETGRPKRPGTNTKDNRAWDLGGKIVTKGSVHSDGWSGTAADLAMSSYIAVHPVTGWWKERRRLGKVNKKTRYSLIVSISTTETSLKLYTAVQNQIAVEAIRV
jgi:hypothetical protein